MNLRTSCNNFANTCDEASKLPNLSMSRRTLKSKLHAFACSDSESTDSDHRDDRGRKKPLTSLFAKLACFDRDDDCKQSIPSEIAPSNLSCFDVGVDVEESLRNRKKKHMQGLHGSGEQWRSDSWMTAMRSCKTSKTRSGDLESRANAKRRTNISRSTRSNKAMKRYVRNYLVPSMMLRPNSARGTTSHLGADFVSRM